MVLRSCVHPGGWFEFTVHRPAFHVANLRENDYIRALGIFPDQTPLENQANFPRHDIDVSGAATVFEVPNLFPFRGVTYINSQWADENAADPARIRLPEAPPVSLNRRMKGLLPESDLSDGSGDRVIERLPEPLCLALAQTGTDPIDLVRLAEDACEFVRDPDTGRPVGLAYVKEDNGGVRARIFKPDRFEILANNPHLPEDYRRCMVLRPGVQGESEIVGEWKSPAGKSHVFEYLRSNSYIPWGHYAANMADDAVRYRIEDLTGDDMTGLRHLYYQRTFVRIAQDLGMDDLPRRTSLGRAELERLRERICRRLAGKHSCNALNFNRTLWGWNFGFDFSPSGYRLHASHQQVHQQYAMIPVDAECSEIPGMETFPYACGDLVEYFAGKYYEQTGVGFFDALLQALKTNVRMDSKKEKPASLVVHEDKNVILFVPKAQTSQWELNLVARKPAGNIVEADPEVRDSLDAGILLAVKALSALGARMITSFEISKRIDSEDPGHRLMYMFLPRLPHSPGAFSESQLRWVNGHYPEDFAAVCRNALDMQQG